MMSRAGYPSIEVLAHLVRGDRYLSLHEVAAMIEVSPWTLQNWRRPNNIKAPDDLPWTYAKEGVFYLASDVERYLARRSEARNGVLPPRSAAVAARVAKQPYLNGGPKRAARKEKAVAVAAPRNAGQLNLGLDVAA